MSLKMDRLHTIMFCYSKSEQRPFRVTHHSNDLQIIFKGSKNSKEKYFSLKTIPSIATMNNLIFLKIIHFLL